MIDQMSAPSVTTKIMPMTPNTSMNKSRMGVAAGETGSKILRFSGPASAVVAVAAIELSRR